MIENNYGCIYKTTNLINGKMYIGQTIYPENIENEKYKGSGVYLQHSIRKHGYNNFKSEIIKFASSKRELNELEISLIKNFNTILPNGYNLSLGGNNPPNMKEVKIKFPDVYKKWLHKVTVSSYLVNHYNGSDAQKSMLKEKHDLGNYDGSYHLVNHYNGSDAQKSMLKEKHNNNVYDNSRFLKKYNTSTNKKLLNKYINMVKHPKTSIKKKFNNILKLSDDFNTYNEFLSSLRLTENFLLNIFSTFNYDLSKFKQKFNENKVH